MEFRSVCQGTNLPSSQMAGPLNKAPLQGEAPLQSLPLLIGSGSDRQPNAGIPSFTTTSVVVGNFQKVPEWCSCQDSIECELTHLHLSVFNGKEVKEDRKKHISWGEVIRSF